MASSVSLCSTAAGRRTPMDLRAQRPQEHSSRFYSGRRRVLSRGAALTIRAAKLKKEQPSESNDDGVVVEKATAEKLAALEARLGKGPRNPSPAAASAAASTPPPSAAPTEPKAPRPSSETVTVELSGPVKDLVDWWLKKDGGLTQLNDLAYKAIFVLAGAWVVFRFIGPVLGLYELSDSLFGPPPP